MLYFAYDSNLSHEQMKERCKNPKYIKKIFLEVYELSFCAINRSYGATNIIKKIDSKVPGGVWKISASDEKRLDYYEGFPIKYSKDFLQLMVRKLCSILLKDDIHSNHLKDGMLI